MTAPSLNTYLSERRAATSLPVRLYALVDALLFGNSQDSALLMRSRANIALFDDTPDAGLAESGPWLIDVEDTSFALREALAQMAAGSDGVSWLTSAYNVEALSREMRERLDARMPDGSVVLLRYYDARVMQQIAGMLTPTQKLAFFVPTFDWFIEIDGTLTRMHSHA